MRVDWRLISAEVGLALNQHDRMQQRVSGTAVPESKKTAKQEKQ